MKEINDNLNEDNNIIDIMQIEELEVKENDPEKYKLQCMLPDYVFDKLSIEEVREFEKKIINYPDLEEEVQDAKALFAHIEKFDYKKMMYDKTQYLPDRVVANLEKRNALHQPWKPKWKQVIGLGIIAAAIIVYFNIFVTDNIQIADSIQQNTSDLFVFTDSEVAMITEIDDLSLDDISYNSQELQNALINFEIDDLPDIDDYYVTTINTTVTEIIQEGSTISTSLDNDYLYFLDAIENVDEEFLQFVLNHISSL